MHLLWKFMNKKYCLKKYYLIGEIIFDWKDVDIDWRDIIWLKRYYFIGEIIFDWGEILFDWGDIIWFRCLIGEILFDWGDIIWLGRYYLIEMERYFLKRKRKRSLFTLAPCPVIRNTILSPKTLNKSRYCRRPAT